MRRNSPRGGETFPLRIVGDVHGHYDHYRHLIAEANHTIQVGDLGFDYRPLTDLDHSRNRVVAGNHDWYGPTDAQHLNWRDHPGFLGDYGTHHVPGFPSIFYCRGAWSIDGALRRSWHLKGSAASWWPEEELSQAELNAAHAAYLAATPAIVVTHECPLSLLEAGLVGNPAFVRQFGYATNAIPTRTNRALQYMLDAHRPKLWVFGHFHARTDVTIDNTRFVGLDQIRPNGNLAGACLDLCPEDFQE